MVGAGTATVEPPVEAGDPRTLHELVARHAAAAPAAPAVTCEGATLTYGDLDRRARAVAAALREHGARPDDVVAVLMPRSADLVAVLYGVLTAGCAYLALAPDDPKPRHAELVRDAGARLLVADRSLAARAPADVETLLAGDIGDIGDPGDGRAGVTEPGWPEQLAYVSYTSGSTGVPKGVAVPHRAVLRLVRGAGWIDLRAADAVLQVAPVSFDASSLEIWGALGNGCRLVVVPGSGPVEVDEVARTMRDEGVTVVNLVTGLFHQMVASALPAFAGVRHVVTGGDVASAEHVRALLDAHPGIVFTNGYGPTENATFTTCWTTRTPPDGETVPIGTAIDGTCVALLDADLRPVPDGTPGEVYASGAGLARGYLGRAGATAEAFVPDPYGAPGTRAYRTGDLAVRRPDGTLEFAGRTDRQVKIQGYRVEPGAVAAALERRRGVARAVVVPQDDPTGRKRLVAYVVPAGAGEAELGLRLEEELRGELPSYLVPWRVLVRDELPLTANGKVDVAALATGRRTRHVPNDFVPPSTDLEARIAALWSELLDVEPVGVEDDFFELGGHSLLAAEVLDALRRDVGVDVPARTLYLQPTVAELSAAVAELAAGGAP